MQCRCEEPCCCSARLCACNISSAQERPNEPVLLGLVLFTYNFKEFRYYPLGRDHNRQIAECLIPGNDIWDSTPFLSLSAVIHWHCENLPSLSHCPCAHTFNLSKPLE